MTSLEKYHQALDELREAQKSLKYWRTEESGKYTNNIASAEYRVKHDLSVLWKAQCDLAAHLMALWLESGEYEQWLKTYQTISNA